MPGMRKAISRLRMLLATIDGKEEALENLRRQFQRQLDRASAYALRGGNSLDATLGIMKEIQERLNDTENTRKHLASIKKRTQDELQALDLTEKVEQAKTELGSLKACETSDKHRSEADREKIQELERFIQEASIRAGQAVSGRLKGQTDVSAGV